MTSDTGGSIQYWAHSQLAWNYYQEQNILSHEQFDAINWRSVHNTQHDLPRLFPLWAFKHVLRIAGTKKNLSHQDGWSPLCPSCQACAERCKHIACCPEVGREAAFQESANAVEKWMETVDTHSDVKVLLLKYLRGCGSTTCLECANSLDLPPILREYASSQDIIGWDNFVMGMISQRLLTIQSAHFHTVGKSHCTTRWIAGLKTQLLQVTHTQWIY